ncbi:MAG: hypothetical protein ACOVRN_02185 [Flavobacterium sp.]
MKKVFTMLTLVTAVSLSFASNGDDKIQENKLKNESSFEFVSGICKGSAVVVNSRGNLEVVNMGDPNKDLITDSAIDCAELYNNFVKFLSAWYPKVLVSSNTYSENK